MLRRDALVKSNLKYDAMKLHAEDYDLWCKMVSTTNIKRLNDVILMYRISESSIYSNNFRVSCKNSLDSNKEYISKLIGEDSSSIHRYFTTFSKALGEKVVIKNLFEVINWVDALTVKFLDKNVYPEEIKRIIIKDSKNRIINLLCEIQWLEFMKLLFYSKITINFNLVNIVLKVSKRRLLHVLNKV